MQSEALQLIPNEGFHSEEDLAPVLQSTRRGSWRFAAVAAALLMATAVLALGAGSTSANMMRMAASAELDEVKDEGGTIELSNDEFVVRLDSSTGVVTYLAHRGSPLLNYVLNSSSVPCFDIPDARWFGDIDLSYHVGAEPQLRIASTSLSRKRVTRLSSAVEIAFLPTASIASVRDFELKQLWELSSDGLSLEVSIKNSNDALLTFGQIGLAWMFSQLWWDKDPVPLQNVIYERRVMNHILTGSSGGGHVLVQSPAGTPPFLLMHPTNSRTAIELTSSAMKGPFAPNPPQCPNWGCASGGLTTLNIVSAGLDPSSAQTSFTKRTNLVVAPASAASLGFRLRWAGSHEQVGDLLRQAGLADVLVTPGMVVPTDQSALVAVRTQQPLAKVVASSNSVVAKLATEAGVAWLNISFLRPSWFEPIDLVLADGREHRLSFSATAPLEQLVPLRAAFIADRQQDTNAASFTHNAFLMYDRARDRLVTRDAYPELPRFFSGGSDDLGFADVLYLSEANVYLPHQRQIDALERYLHGFLWGTLQNPSTFEVIRWAEPPAQRHCSCPSFCGSCTDRSYNYVHVANLWFNAYRSRTLWPHAYPTTPASVSARECLARAFGTSRVFFTRPMWSNGGTKLGNMGESVFPLLIAALGSEAGMHAERDLLSGWWASKGDWFASQYDSGAYPFGSEISQDTTAFEAVHALASTTGHAALMHAAAAANMATRGHQRMSDFKNYGVDDRCFGDTDYQLSYMTPLGGLSLLDYAVRNLSTAEVVDDRSWREVLPIAAGSLLGMWSSVNTGQIESRSSGGKSLNSSIGSLGWVLNHHFFRNASAADWSADAKKTVNALTGEAGIGLFGALRAAAAVIAPHPMSMVGGGKLVLVAYNARLEPEGGEQRDLSQGQQQRVCMTPQDGVRQRAHFLLPLPAAAAVATAHPAASTIARPLSLRIDRDAIAVACVNPTALHAPVPGSGSTYAAISITIRPRSVVGATPDPEPAAHNVSVALEGLPPGRSYALVLGGKPTGRSLESKSADHAVVFAVQVTAASTTTLLEFRPSADSIRA